MGTGLIRAASAIESALRQLAPSSIINNVDILQLDRTWFLRRAAQNALRVVEQAPHKVAYRYEQLDKPPNERHFPINDRFLLWQRNLRRRLGIHLMLKSFIPLLQSKPWDSIISVDTFAGSIVASLKHQGKVSAPHSLITTDFVAHRSQVGIYDHYFTATEESAMYLQSLGVRAESISVTGIPIHPDFSRAKDRVVCLKSQGLPGDCPIVLQMAGGLGMGSAEEVFTALLAIKVPLGIVTVTGHNQRLKKRLEQIAVPTRHRVKVLGFIDQIDELMRVAEVVVSKPGGLTAAEVLACGTAMVIVNPLPGLETRNSDFLLENGAAIKNHHVETLPHQLAQLLCDHQRLTLLRSNARRLGKPQAAFDVARQVLERVQHEKVSL
jgi:processive 1,2-diacylglycerol beta-glucosyltransferase